MIESEAAASLPAARAACHEEEPEALLIGVKHLKERAHDQTDGVQKRFIPERSRQRRIVFVDENHEGLLGQRPKPLGELRHQGSERFSGATAKSDRREPVQKKRLEVCLRLTGLRKVPDH